MYFILSKLLYFLILPMYWVIGLVIIAWWVKNGKLKRRLLITAGIIFYLFSIPLGFEMFGRLWDVTSYPPANKKYSCAIILGGFASAGGPQGGHFTGAADRFIQGVKLLKSGQATHLLISGGNSNLMPGEFREAIWVKTQLNSLGVPDSLILIESKSKNTLENAGFSKSILDSAGLKPPYLLVTSAFHMRRSLMIFKHAEMEVIPYPSHFIVSGNQIDLGMLLPSTDTLANWSFYIKEVMGYVVNYLK